MIDALPWKKHCSGSSFRLIDLGLGLRGGLVGEESSVCCCTSYKAKINSINWKFGRQAPSERCLHLDCVVHTIGEGHVGNPSLRSSHPGALVPFSSSKSLPGRARENKTV